MHIDYELPNPEEKHVALGQFMDTWSKMELMLRHKLEDLLITPHRPTAEAVSNSNSGKSLSDLIQTLSSLHLNQKDFREYSNLLDRFLKLNTKRNYLVHGAWIIELIVGLKNDEPYVEVYEARQYEPINRDEREKLNKLINQSIRSRYIFRLDAINKAEQDIAALYKNFTSFHNAKLTRVRNP